MSRLNKIIERFPDVEFISIDYCDKAIIGIDLNVEPFRLVYSANKIVKCFIDQGWNLMMQLIILNIMFSDQFHI